MRPKSSTIGIDGRLHWAILLVLTGVYHYPGAVLANSGTIGAGCQEIASPAHSELTGRPIVIAQVDYGHAYNLNGSAGYAPEEELLTSCLGYLKGRDINGAVANLQELTREFPDNEDYSLLLKMGQKRQGAQQWYRYQEWVENKQKYSRPYAELSRRLTKSSNGPGRVNELKRSIWYMLAEEKKAANQER